MIADKNSCVVFSTDKPKYDYSFYERKFGSGHNRKCINGKITGSCNCVGYCAFSEHSGFLTEKLRKEHDCLGKKCFHYFAKSKRDKTADDSKKRQKELVEIANDFMIAYEGIRVIDADKSHNENWQIRYVSISNEYPISYFELTIADKFGEPIKFKKIDADFDTAVKLIFG